MLAFGQIFLSLLRTASGLPGRGRTSPPLHTFVTLDTIYVSPLPGQTASGLPGRGPHEPAFAHFRYLGQHLRFSSTWANSQWPLGPLLLVRTTTACLGPTEIIARPARTNLLVQGRVSTDRSEVAALLITTPWPRTKSSTNDLTPPRRMGWISYRPPSALIGATVKTSFCGPTRRRGARPRRRHIVATRRRGGQIIVAYPGGILA